MLKPKLADHQAIPSLVVQYSHPFVWLTVWPIPGTGDLNVDPVDES